MTVRPLEAGDRHSIKAIWEDFSSSPFAIYDVPHEYHEDTMKHLLADGAFFAVCLDGKVIGYFDFHRTPHGMDTGYCFHSKYHGHGYAQESFKALIEYFTSKGIKHFTAGTALQNIPSVRLLQSLGFRKVREETLSFHEGITFTGGVFELYAV